MVYYGVGRQITFRQTGDKSVQCQSSNIDASGIRFVRAQAEEFEMLVSRIRASTWLRMLLWLLKLIKHIQWGAVNHTTTASGVLAPIIPALQGRDEERAFPVRTRNWC